VGGWVGGGIRAGSIETRRGVIGQVVSVLPIFWADV
jgi:hypothetical protein